MSSGEKHLSTAAKGAGVVDQRGADSTISMIELGRLLVLNRAV